MKICEGCGANLQADALTCAFCGRVYEKELRPPKAVCPICRSDQSVAKVASIYWAHSKIKTAKIGDTLENSNLYDALKPPAAPTKPFNLSPLAQTILSIVALIFILILLSSIFLPIILFLGILFDIPTIDWSNPFGRNFNLIIASIFIVLLLVLSSLAFQRYFKFRKANLVDEQAYKKSYSLWQTYQQRWEKLYYCHTDGIVFLPEKNLTISPQYVQSFIKEHQYFGE
ncbi:MAG TPA: hypothetical protein PK299_12520 [Anaerolineales bacterium]|nr:hypothetical protein [Anaerolineales bacterium]